MRLAVALFGVLLCALGALGGLSHPYLLEMVVHRGECPAASDLHSWTSIEHHSVHLREACFAKCVEGMHCSFAFLEESKFILEEFATCVLFNNVPGEYLFGWV